LKWVYNVRGVGRYEKLMVQLSLIAPPAAPFPLPLNVE